MTKNKETSIGFPPEEPRGWKSHINKELATIKSDINSINIVMVGVVIALFIAFFFFITDDYKYKAEMYKDYKNDVKNLNNKLDKLQIN